MASGVTGPTVAPDNPARHPTEPPCWFGRPAPSYQPRPTLSPVEARTNKRTGCWDTYRPNFWLWVVWKKRPQFRVEFPAAGMRTPCSLEAAPSTRIQQAVREAGGEKFVRSPEVGKVSLDVPPGLCLSSPLAPGCYNRWFAST